LIISKKDGYEFYEIEYADKTGLELKVEYLKIINGQYNDFETRTFVVWWESSFMKKVAKAYIDTLISSCCDSLYIGIPFLF